jgi:hypothetical protein
VDFSMDLRILLLVYFSVGTVVSILVHIGIVRILLRNNPRSEAEERVITIFTHLYWVEYWIVVLLSMIVWPLLVFKGIVRGMGGNDAN